MSETITKKDVEAEIYNMAGAILMGKATGDEIEKVVKLAKKHGLLNMVRKEFGDIQQVLQEIEND